MKFEQNPDVIESIQMWAMQRRSGLYQERANAALVERLEYVFFMHENHGYENNTMELDDNWEHA